MPDQPPSGPSIVELFAAQAARTPDAPAVEFNDSRLTYAELAARSNQLARHLARAGVAPEVLVTLAIEPSLELVVSLLAIWKARGACLLVDPRSPLERLAFVQRDAGAQLLLDGNGPSATGESDSPLPDLPAPHSLAYVIYTSGSTGRPKGVEVEHAGLAHLLQAQREVLALAPSDRVLQFASLGFDAAVAEVAMALGAGATLCLAPRDTLVGPSLFDLLRRRRITCATLPPSLLAASPPEPLPDLRHLFAAGEPCPASVVDRWAPGRTFRNLYGPTEATVWATAALCRPGLPPTLGTPIPGTTVHLLDGSQRPVPDGSDGELCIGGPGVARGYRHRPDLTAERFPTGPFGRLFRSGDRARLLPDGTIDFLGRLDRQVKIRGVRVELGEIEAALVERAGANEAAVELRHDPPGDPRLVAWVVSSDTPASLRARLAPWLPDAMQPSAYVPLAALPRGPSGKVDHAALPPPGRDRDSAPYLPPRSDSEQWLARQLADLLAVDRVGLHDDLFTLGAHSLTAARLAARLRADRGLDLTVARLFASPTVESLARELDALAAATTPPIAPLPAGVEAPPSFAQERLCVVDELAPGLAVYNAPLLLRLSGPGAADPAAWTRALDALLRRHAPLRTTFARSSGRLRALVADPHPFDLPVVDLRPLSPTEREAELLRRAREEARLPFDLARGPLLRATLLVTADREATLLLSLHHTITDGWSTSVLLSDLLALHQGAPLAPLPIQYGDAAAWERARLDGPPGARLTAHWKERLAGLAPLALPADRPPPRHRTHPGARLPLRIDPAIARTLVELARAERCTPYMVLLALFQALLARYTGQEDIAVGSPVANRPRPELEPLVGCFVNTLVLRTSLAGDPTFRDLLHRARATALDAFAHADLPFDRLVAALNPDRDASTPFVRALLLLENAPEPPPSRGDLHATAEPLDTGTAMFDLTLSLRERDQTFEGYLEYDTDLFDAATANRMLNSFHMLLRVALASPDRRIAHVPLLSAEERAHLLHASTGPTPPPPDRCVHDQVAAHAARTPSAPAVIAGSDTLTYGDLHLRARRLAAHLASLGAAGRPIALLLDRSLDLAVALLGILEAGSPCVPLDPGHPKERLAHQLAETRAPIVVTHSSRAADLGAHDATLVCLDRDAAAIARHPTNAAPRPATLDDLAYILYTSGSTGRPKGVCMPHRALANLVDWQITTHPPSSRTLQLAPLSFDVAFQEIFTTWCAGSTLVLADPSEPRDPSLIERLVANHRIDRLFLPTALLHALADHSTGDPRPLSSLREILVAGEALTITPDLIRLFTALPDCTLYNHYGPTETHVVTEHRLAGPPAAWPSLPPIGTPIAHTRLLLLDAAGEPVPLGVPGEIHVGGAPLARGYVDPDRTAERFLPDPFGPPGARLYRTGDLARRRPDGTLEFLGRADDQLKVRGFRVEPGEIEAVLATHPQVASARVIPRHDRLVAYLVPSPGTPPTDASLRTHAAAWLPAYMLPSSFVLLDALPLGPNGKLDRAALPDPPPPDAARYLAPRSETERRIAEIWQQLLRLPRVGVDDDFFAIGGHSLLVMQVVSRIARAFSIKLLPRDLFDRPTVAALAEQVDQILIAEIEGSPGEAS